jgi:hypothetical protein
MIEAGTAWLEGDRSRVAAALAAMTTLASSLEREAPFLAGLSGVAAEQALLAVSERILSRDECDAMAVELLRRSRSQVDLRQAWRRVIANVRVVARLAGGT